MLKDSLIYGVRIKDLVSYGIIKAYDPISTSSIGGRDVKNLVLASPAFSHCILGLSFK